MCVIYTNYISSFYGGEEIWLRRNDGKHKCRLHSSPYFLTDFTLFQIPSTVTPKKSKVEEWPLYHLINLEISMHKVRVVRISKRNYLLQAHLQKSSRCIIEIG